MALKTVLERINKAREEYEAAMQEAGKDLPKQIAEALGEALRQCPEEYVQIQWTQYTPSFNDGDPCRFSVGDVYLQREDDEEGDGDWLGRKPGMQPVADVWAGINKDTLETAFGSGSKITVKRDGSFEIDDYYCGY